MKKLVITLILSTLAPVALADAPPQAMICKTCHGEAGAKPILGSYPKINGQNKEYLANTLKQYRARQRTGGLSALMVAQSAALSDADIEALAEYYSKQ